MEQIRAASQKVQEMITGLSRSMQEQVVGVKELTVALENVSEMSQSISSATEEQSVNAKQVSTAVENVNDVTQSAASAAEEVSASTAQLASMAVELQKLTSQFQIESKVQAAGGALSVLDTAPIDKAIGAHGAWKQRLADAAEGRGDDLKVDVVRADDACEFGKWFAGAAWLRSHDGNGKRVQSLHGSSTMRRRVSWELAQAGRRNGAHAGSARKGARSPWCPRS